MLSVSKKKYMYQNLVLMECQKMLNILYKINDLNGKYIYTYLYTMEKYVWFFLISLNPFFDILIMF